MGPVVFYGLSCFMWPLLCLYGGEWLVRQEWGPGAGSESDVWFVCVLLYVSGLALGALFVYLAALVQASIQVSKQWGAD